MAAYDFSTLSPYEFEELTRDLLQAEWNIRLESFGQGSDGGIDLRYAEGDNLIVQCKRYRDFEGLFQILKGELTKVKKLQPSRYIIATSASLSPNQKGKIQELFYSYIHSAGDIFGRDDLNNLLRKHERIERNNFKLWLSSTSVLQTIINRQVVNQTRFAIDEIQDKVKIYVQNQSFNEASKILDENKYVVISGIPGIGKTTLAEMLVFDILANSNYEFVLISESIREGFANYEEGKSQVFLFDDFLGSNFLENNLHVNEEKQIVRFIRKIKSSKDKLLIFTTREYILNQAKLKSEELDREEFIKCILDLSKYTTIVKAKILYNHLYFSGVLYDYIQPIIAGGQLMKIIEHKNYSPRIIDYVCKSRLWEQYTYSEFPSVLLGMFDSPFKVWEHAFENQISEDAKLVLYSLLICGADLAFENLLEQFKKFKSHATGDQNPMSQPGIFKRALKELDNSFIQIYRSRENDTFVRFHNPSIQDFLIDHTDRDVGLKAVLIGTSLYLKPFLNIFSTNSYFPDHSRRFTVSPELMELLIRRVMLDFDLLHYSLESFYRSPSPDDLLLLKLDALNRHLLGTQNSQLDNFIEERFKSVLYSENITNRGLHSYNSLLLHFYANEDSKSVDAVRILLNIAQVMWSEEDFAIFDDFERYFNEQFILFRDEYSAEYQDAFRSALEDLADTSSNEIDSLEENITSLKNIERNYSISVDEEVYALEIKIERVRRQKEEEEAERNYYYQNYRIRHQEYSPLDKHQLIQHWTSRSFYSPSMKEQIEGIFRSLDEG